MNLDEDFTVRQLLKLSNVELAAYRDWWRRIRTLLSPEHSAAVEKQLRRDADALNRLNSSDPKEP